MKKLNVEALPRSLLNNLGLCYFDPVTEKLVEFNNEELIYLTPYENIVRRYYLVIMSDLYNGIKLQYGNIKFSSIYEEVEVKILEGLGTINDKYNFDDVEANNTITVFFNNYSTGIIPIDVNIKSLVSTHATFELDINITAM